MGLAALYCAIPDKAMSSILALSVATCVVDRSDTSCLRDMDSPSQCLLRGEAISLSHRGVGSGRNTKIALQVKGQGQKLPKSNGFYG